MALFIPTTDGRGFRDDDVFSSPKSSRNRLSRSNTIDAPPAAAELQPQHTAAENHNTTTIPRKRIVFPDPVAFRYLQDDPGVTVIEQRGILRGYELYIVEQWACSRQSPTLVVVTYTGDEKHSVVVGVLSIPEDESLWSSKLRVYFKATQQYHARPKETELGDLMVTNLNSFPSALAVIPVPDGDIKQHRQAFIVNEDLKRLGCSGRSGLTLTEPTEATQAKFQQLYRISERVPCTYAVPELIKLCQVALYMFEKLDHEYIDGLLCDVTERAIGNWWTEVGAEHYNFDDPTDGILGPTTVAALLGMLMGARNRLQWCGAPVSKDVFDIDQTKRGVAYFQRAQKLERTRRLDRQTLFRLHTATAKAAAGEGWGVQKAVKSTMTEIGGKRGEIVMGMVSGKDKGGLADIETLDIDRFVSLAYGERPKWLWHGKPRRSVVEHQDFIQDKIASSFVRDDPLTQAAKRIQSVPVEDDAELQRREELLGPALLFPVGTTPFMTESPADRDGTRKTVFRSVAGKMSDARGRIKDAVGAGRRGHASKPSMSAREEPVETGTSLAGNSATSGNSAGVVTAPAVVSRVFTWKNRPEEYLEVMRQGESETLPELSEEAPQRVISAEEFETAKDRPEDEDNSKDQDLSTHRIDDEANQAIRSRATSVARSTTGDSEPQPPSGDVELKTDLRHLVLGRRNSFDPAEMSPNGIPNEDRWPRRMSFADAEEAVLTWDSIIDVKDAIDDIRGTEDLPEVACRLNETIEGITFHLEPWVDQKLKMIELLSRSYGRDEDELQLLYQQLRDACQMMRSNSDELLAEERAQLTESVKEIEVLAQRLDYEIGGLAQRVTDLEDGVVNFERQVEDVEFRTEELKAQLETESWLHWFVRTLTGVGTGPNITRTK